MDKREAIAKLNKLIGTDLRPLANKFGVTVWKGERINKGWAGHTIERYLGLPLNSSQSPNFGSWELKVVPLIMRKKLGLRVKETMAITMIDDVEVEAKTFKESHLYAKLRKMVLVARMFENKTETGSRVHSVATFDLEDEELIAGIRADYELVRRTIKMQGFEKLTGKMGVFVQPRTKGPGHGSTSRAFYARKMFVAKILNL